MSEETLEDIYTAIAQDAVDAIEDDWAFIRIDFFFFS